MSEPTAAALHVADLHKSYRHPFLPWRILVEALRGVTFDVRPGEVFGLLGPNGSGKSTAIKIILGLNRPTRGLVRIHGLPPEALSVRERVGYLPEESYLYHYLSPVEILDFYGRLFRLPRAERRRRTDDLLAFVGLEGARDRRVGEFSKGMQRRVAFAQCLIGDPDVVVLDEPTSGLDAIGIAEMKRLILELQRLGKTVLMCSHRMTDVEDVCDRIIILVDGRPCAMGSVEELAARGEHLEPYFLRVVAEARAADPRRSGAGASAGAVPAFLTRHDHGKGSADPCGDAS